MRLKGPSASRQIFQNAFGEQRLNVRQGSIGAAEPKVSGDFAQCRRNPFRILLPPNKLQNLLLPFREFLHTVQMSSISKILSS